MGKRRYTSNDLTLLGVTILKEKKHLNGHIVYLVKFPHNDLLWALVHIGPKGNILDSQCYIWSGHNDKLKKTIQLQANRDFKKWSRNDWELI